MDMISEVRAAQAEVDKVFENLVKRLQEMGEGAEPEGRSLETVYPMTADPAIFKGTTPTCVLFGTQRVIAHTWKNVFKLMILECNKNPAHHRTLMELRNKILGRERILLSDSDSGMLRPFRIDENMYAETHYDTASLMRVLLHRILDVVGFDYSDISVGVRKMGRYSRNAP